MPQLSAKLLGQPTRSKGKRLGWPAIPDELLEKAKALRQEGLLFRKIGKELGIDEGAVRKRMNERSHRKVV